MRRGIEEDGNIPYDLIAVQFLWSKSVLLGFLFSLTSNVLRMEPKRAQCNCLNV